MLTNATTMRIVKQKLTHSGLTMEDEESREEVPAAWSAEQANAWRAKNTTISLWRIVQLQAGFGALLVVLLGIIAESQTVAWSATYGVVCVLVPAAMFAHGVREVVAEHNVGQGMLRFIVWELAKIALTIAMLCLAPALVSNLNWLALLAGFVVTLKVYWVAVWLRPVQNKSILVN